MNRDLVIGAAILLFFGTIRLMFGEEISNIVIWGSFILLVIVAVTYIFIKIRSYNILMYENALKDLKDHPEDPNIREKCFTLGKKFYEQDNSKLSTIELTTLINSDISKSIGHLEYQNKLSLQI